MKAPPKRKGNLRWLVRACSANLTLNESPSEKEGKSCRYKPHTMRIWCPSMKVPPKRKGNPGSGSSGAGGIPPSMKVPPKRKGNLMKGFHSRIFKSPSMKVPPKRKGNRLFGARAATYPMPLNESPSEKEGKSSARTGTSSVLMPPQ